MNQIELACPPPGPGPAVCANPAPLHRQPPGTGPAQAAAGEGAHPDANAGQFVHSFGAAAAGNWVGIIFLITLSCLVLINFGQLLIILPFP